MSAPTNLHRDIGRIEGKLDAVLSEMRDGLRQAHKRLDGHDEDIEALKKESNQRHGVVKAALWFWGMATTGATLLFGSGYLAK
jgi:hypothetical protein